MEIVLKTHTHTYTHDTHTHTHTHTNDKLINQESTTWKVIASG